ncbi:MAG: hypothetical protein VX681_02505 [Myxococcota bacterium]|nr:hypothetical protein [Myxococcota bacterium]
MTSRILLLAVLATAFAVAPSLADAAGSCSGYAVIRSYDAGKKVAKIKYAKGRENVYFPRPEGGVTNSKLPKPCRGKIKKKTDLVITPTGGRMTVTQVRANFTGKMLNDTEDATWVPGQLEKLIADKTKVVVLLRQGLGKDAPYGITTIYLPITDEERAEIARIEAQVEDVD